MILSKIKMYINRVIVYLPVRVFRIYIYSFLKRKVIQSKVIIFNSKLISLFSFNDSTQLIIGNKIKGNTTRQKKYGQNF